MRPLAKSNGITLSAELPPSGTCAMADPERVHQLLSNIIGNAIKFTPTGGLVSLAIHLTDAEVLFEVTDTGEGIDPDQLPYVFERFYQANVSGRRVSRHGAGLGLPIARGIVEAHHGRIWIESTLGQGTTVRFTLPRAEATA